MTEMPDPAVLPTERLEHEITTLGAPLERVARAHRRAMSSDEATRHERRADAFVEVVRTAVGGDDDAAIPCEISVIVEAGANGYIDGGPALDPDTLLRLACDAAIVRLVEGDTVIATFVDVDEGRSSRCGTAHRWTWITR